MLTPRSYVNKQGVRKQEYDFTGDYHIVRARILFDAALGSSTPYVRVILCDRFLRVQRMVRPGNSPTVSVISGTYLFLGEFFIFGSAEKCQTVWWMLRRVRVESSKQ